TAPAVRWASGSHTRRPGQTPYRPARWPDATRTVQASSVFSDRFLMPGNFPSIAVIGAGPAGLMAAEVMAAAGLSVTVYDAMPSAGRKLLRAGIGGLNLTHAEPRDAFLSRYRGRRDAVAPL